MYQALMAAKQFHGHVKSIEGVIDLEMFKVIEMAQRSLTVRVHGIIRDRQENHRSSSRHGSALAPTPHAHLCCLRLRKVSLEDHRSTGIKLRPCLCTSDALLEGSNATSRCSTES